MSLFDALDRIRLNSFAISKGKSLAKIKELEGIIKELEDKLRLTTVGQWHFKSERDIHIKESEQFVIDAKNKIEELSKRVHELEKGIDNILAGEAYYMAKPHKVYDIFEGLKKLMTDDSKPE